LSTTNTWEAPRIIALCAAIRPTGPAPKTTTRSPGCMPASSVPCQPVGKMSDSMAKSFSWALPGGSSSRLKSA
jgi:hypothetical protein